MLVFGILLIASMVLMPAGIFGTLDAALARLSRRRGVRP
jgi:ABC-type branched-subunit amino acid transport system permease subunit